jgi:hypothetical protein
MLALNGQELLDRGGTIYENVSLLIQLRNAIVHYQIGFRTLPADPLKLEKRLHGKFPVCRYYEKSTVPLFPHRCLGAGCAIWAVKTAKKYADDFHRRLGITGTTK